MLRKRRMDTYAALLRGINLGARNKVSMADLKAVLTSRGFEEVVTYVQSGNVVLRSPPGEADDIAGAIEHAIADTFGFSVTVVLRTPGELQEIADGNPFADESDPTKLLVVFLARAPAASATARLDPDRSPPDRFSVRGREIYLHVPNGFGRSKLTLDYFERRLSVNGTVRNWRTLTKLLELTA